MKFILMLSLLSLFAAGCGPFSPAYYQPPPETFETWKKSDASILEVQKALLECGSSPVDSQGNTIVTTGTATNNFVERHDKGELDYKVTLAEKSIGFGSSKIKGTLPFK